MSIHKIQQGDNLTKSKNLVADNIDKLKELFPEIVTEGKIDFKVLQDVLGENIEEEDEYYRFTWAGKAQARREAHKPSTGTLRPVKEDSVDWNTTENVYIEGDNLEVLKLLQKSYAGKVKMIYIDPPYNTGKDFVYKDNYKDNLKNYQEVTGQVDSEGNKLSTNSDSDGRYHSNWLNMMYPRLRLARNLLKEDGVIFMSIDDNEVDNLKKVANEVFGESNYITTIANINNPKGRSDDKYIATAHEYILVYKKRDITFYGWKPGEHITRRYNKTDENGVYREIDLRKTGDNDRRVDRPNLFYYFYYNENTKELIPSKTQQNLNGFIEIIPTREDGSDGNWRWELNSTINKHELLIARYMTVREKWGVFVKDYLTEDKRVKPTNAWTQKFANSERGTEQFIGLGFIKQIFTNPKPVGLIKSMLEMTTRNNDIILDFFGGSSSTVHSLMEFNCEENQNINYILVQLPEKTDKKSEAFKAGYKTIAEIGKERIRRAGKKIAEENPEKAKYLDLGFKVFKLDSSNIKSWDGNPENLQEELFDAVSNIKTDRTEEDVLYEILLKYGLDLTLPIEEKIIEGKTVFNVGFGALFISLGDKLTNKVAEGIGAWKEELQPEICRVIFKDTGFTDVEKTNSIQTLKRFGITEIKSI
ncbi:site-specific DNA-methyltransferase [Tenacibaculum finnmarkense]|uniref:site-specific DNA-methyltransferase n=1 Tax=Tenacibaculum finnmarkense TaxID=2781243 RepID=UPI00187BBEEA|nr:site-specific DNA-methyltransferase [Tenacibaculum finnmarkense]MBE7697628.1 site-specific DNA-methyltransferase [Tenacibaculum finnmarkense genomovar ulcerans]MCD8422285.1 site-specific DNA-methyltransferase [Tenacibaculum finnmarkense genomovar ulcerans]MCD8427055.1 site-specific DNA-methyltransferase [Tenacibaculum finnmarkense genomovar finnmarkense]MCG8210957.1 site-specific DNA-methyltransferase [Tenacibaculum finnmarkense genomovar finnmarkense]MCG8225651.1 site-specific DNA-methyltr